MPPEEATPVVAEGLKRKQRPDEAEIEAATVATAAKKPREGLSFAEQLDKDKRELDARHAREYAAKDVEVQRELAGIHVQRLKEQERAHALLRDSDTKRVGCSSTSISNRWARCPGDTGTCSAKSR